MEDCHWMPSSPCSRGPQGWTYSKLIVWILFSFPERPGILELLHFIGSVVAGKDTASVVLSLLQKALLDLTAQNLGHASREPSLTHYALKLTASTTRAGVGTQCDFTVHLFLKFLFAVFRETGESGRGERETWMCCSTWLCIH